MQEISFRRFQAEEFENIRRCFTVADVSRTDEKHFGKQVNESITFYGKHAASTCT